jgi:serine/threonine protein phosphatase PrpC
VSEQTVSSAADVLAPARKYRKCIAVSPSSEKNQDRAVVERTETFWVATVCDGVTQSAYSADAADLISDASAGLWKEGGLKECVQLLQRRREELMASELPELVDETSFMSRARADILREKRRQAFQTTLISVRMTPLEGNEVLLEAKSCGDSALFVFDRIGQLTLSNLKLEDENSPFDHASPFTDVLPDHFRGEEPSLSTKIDGDAHVILCSDGFYDAFTNPGALFRWLLLNGDKLPDALSDLHVQLDGLRGDDDISLVWLCPVGIETEDDAAEAAPADVIAKQDLPARGGVLRWLLRRLLRIFRFGPPVSGGLCW